MLMRVCNCSIFANCLYFRIVLSYIRSISSTLPQFFLSLANQFVSVLQKQRYIAMYVLVIEPRNPNKKTNRDNFLRRLAKRDLNDIVERCDERMEGIKFQ